MPEVADHSRLSAACERVAVVPAVVDADPSGAELAGQVLGEVEGELGEALRAGGERGEHGIHVRGPERPGNPAPGRVAWLSTRTASRQVRATAAV